MPYSNLTQLNTYEFGNKTDIDDLTTEIDNRFKSPATVTEHTATTTTPEAGALVVYVVATPVAAGTISLTMPTRFRFVSVTATRTTSAGAASTLVVSNSGAAITDAINCNLVATKVCPLPADTNVTNSRINAGGTLDIVTLGANNAMMVTVTGYHT